MPEITTETIWKSETEQALVNFIKHLLTYKDETGIVKNVAAYVREPSETLKTESFPCVTVYNTYDAHNVYRRQYDDRPLVVSRDIAAKTALVEKPPNPFDLFYQIDFWSLKNREMNDLTLAWLDNCATFFNLDCKDRSDNVRNIFCKQRGNMKKADYFLRDRKENARVFHSIIEYRVWVEIYERKLYTNPIVKDGGIAFNLDKLMKGE